MAARREDANLIAHVVIFLFLHLLCVDSTGSGETRYHSWTNSAKSGWNSEFISADQAGSACACRPVM